MNISVEKLPKSEVKITITLTEQETQKHMEKAAKEVGGMVKVPGFRPGKAPLKVLKEHVKPGAIEGHMLDIAIPATYAEAVKKEDLQVITRPKVEIKEISPLSYTATVGIYPEVKISGYDKIKVKPQDTTVEEKDVNAILEDIQMRHATYNKVDRTAQKGDRVEIDFEGFDQGGASLDSAKSKHQPVIIGAGNFVPGFEDALIGTKKGDNKEFTVKFPKDYFHKPFQNKKVTFKILVHEVEEVKKPELNAEFLKQITGGQDQSLDQVKENIKKSLKHERKQAERTRREDEFLNKIAELTKVELPPTLLEEEIDSMMEEFKSSIAEKGLTLQQYLEGAKTTIENLREMRKKDAEKRLTLRFGLQQLFKQENLEATKEELDKEVEQIRALYPENEHEKIQQEYEEGSYLQTRLTNKIKMDKLFAKYLSQ